MTLTSSSSTVREESEQADEDGMWSFLQVLHTFIVMMMFLPSQAYC
jgi:hypothetical protein